jgi:hypothetical protein
MKQLTVTITTVLTPDPVTIDAGDIVVWVNNTSDPQTASSNDAGQTFTTGPIQPNANSLPIAVPASTVYSVSPAGLQGSITVTMPLSFGTDIKPLFTAMDQDHMLNQVGLFDLWKYDDVKAHADDILGAVTDGSMPPPGNGEEQWSPSQVKKFKDWMDGGFLP